jgi:hypothetical protein
MTTDFFKRVRLICSAVIKATGGSGVRILLKFSDSGKYLVAIWVSAHVPGATIAFKKKVYRVKYLLQGRRLVQILCHSAHCKAKGRNYTTAAILCLPDLAALRGLVSAISSLFAQFKVLHHD